MVDSSEWLTSKQVADLLGMSIYELEYLPEGVLASRHFLRFEGEEESIWVYPPESVEAIRASIETASLEKNPRLKSLVFNNPEIHEVYEALGYSPLLQHQMVSLASEIRACCDLASLTASGSSSIAVGDVFLAPGGAESLHAALCRSPLDWDRPVNVVIQHLWDAAVESRASLLMELQDRSGSLQRPDRISGRHVWSIIHDGVNAVSCDQLPHEMLMRKQEFDCLLFDIAVRIPGQAEPDRSVALAFTARTYLNENWMHNRSLTERLATDIFRLVRIDAGRMKIPPLWPSVIAVAAVAASLYFRIVEIAFLLFVLTLIFVLPLVHRGWTISRLGAELDRVGRELSEDWFSGRVLARRVERLYDFGAPVPSVLPALLQLLP